tara:strand:+ start:43 stop:1020 length:978 start_codon:yes stop_codon:yes gene_type:complete
MIIKHFEISEKTLAKFDLYLFYGKNEGLQNEIIKHKLIINFNGKIEKYDETEFIQNYDDIVSSILNKSFFDNKKIFIISRTTEKSIKIIENLKEKNLDEIKIIFKSGALEKKSKLRSLFEKEKNLALTAFYEDNARDLTNIAFEFLNKNNIKLSREAVNLLVNRASGERKNLKTELEKIYNYSLSNKNVSLENVLKLSNLAENYAVNELADSYFLKNKKNIAKILNENIYSNEDCVLIIRTLLGKSKKLRLIIEENLEIRNIDRVISNFKPPIFWKDKENVKNQANSWDLNDLKEVIYKINDLELAVKTNSNQSLNLVSDFVINC